MAQEHQYDLGPVGLSHGIVNSQAITKSNGGLTSLAQSQTKSSELNLGPLEIGSAFTHTKTKTNGAESKALSHDLNVGKFGLTTSLSRDNIRKGFGIQHSGDGNLQLGLGPLNINLSEKQKSAKAFTQANARAQGLNAKAKSKTKVQTQSEQIALLGVKKSTSQSNAFSRTDKGKTSASAEGLAGGGASNVASFDQNRTPKNQASPLSFLNPLYLNRDFDFLRGIPAFHNIPQIKYVRSKRRTPVIYFPDSYQYRPYQPLNKQNANAEGLAINKNVHFEQQAGANSQSNQILNANGLFQNNGASSIGSNLATDGSSGQLSAANANQDSSFTNTGSQIKNTAQSQSLNFNSDQKQAANANAGTTHIQNASGQRLEAHGGSQSTNTNMFGTSSNIANTNSVVFEEGNSRGSQADSSSQSIFQGNNGENAAAQTNAKVQSVRGPDGSISNTATSNASTVSHGGKNANAVASASSGVNQIGGHANSNAGTNFGFGALANSGAFGNFGGFQGFAGAQSGTVRG